MALPVSLRKSTDCSYYLKGSCKKGDAECEFRHNPLALSPAVKDCAFWFNGRCAKGAACPFRHLAQNYGAYGMPRAPAVDPSTVPCVFYAQGKCLKGDACPYSHSLTLPGAVAVEEGALNGSEEGELRVGQAQADADVDATLGGGRRTLSWRAQSQVVQEAAPAQESMVMQFDEEDEEPETAEPSSDVKHRTTPTKARRGPLWEVRSTISRTGEPVRSVSRNETRTEKRDSLGEGRRRDRQEEGGVHRRVVSGSGPSIKDRLGGGVNQGNQVRVQSKVDPQESQRERVVVDLQRGLLSKGADRWGRNRNQSEPVRDRKETQEGRGRRETQPEGKGASNETEEQPRKFGAEARRRWLEMQKEKGSTEEPKQPEKQPSRDRAQLRDLVELGATQKQETESSTAEKKDGPRILTLAEIRAAKKRNREEEEAKKATEEATREAKRQAPVRLNRAGIVTGDAQVESSMQPEQEEPPAERREAENGVEEETANDGEEGTGMQEEGGDEEAYEEEENGSEYQDEGEEDGEDDIADLMKKYGDVVEDQD